MTVLQESSEKSKTVELRGKLVKKDREALEKLCKLERNEEASILYFEAAEAAISGRGRRKTAHGVTIMKYAEDVFLNQPLTYPLLFSRDVKLTMSRSELMTELTLIMAMAQPNLINGPHIYSIQVLEPKNITGFVDLNKLGEYFGGSVPPDIKSGYIYGPLLYETPHFVRSVVLEGVLGNAGEVEVALRNPSTLILERKRVTLSQS